VIALSAPVRAEVITYRCNNEGILETYRVDTETRSVQLTVPGHPVHNGAAQVNGATIVVTLTSPRVWSIQINRNTGAFQDSDGDTGNCQLVK
jgi:hypothetical protein